MVDDVKDRFISEGEMSQAAGDLMRSVRELTPGQWEEHKANQDQAINLFLTGAVGGAYAAAEAQARDSFTMMHCDAS